MFLRFFNRSFDDRLIAPTNATASTSHFHEKIDNREKTVPGTVFISAI
jgi:hypothetical protein